MCVCVLCAPVPTLLERPGVGGENALFSQCPGPEVLVLVSAVVSREDRGEGRCLEAERRLC